MRAKAWVHWWMRDAEDVTFLRKRVDLLISTDAVAVVKFRHAGCGQENFHGCFL